MEKLIKWTSISIILILFRAYCNCIKFEQEIKAYADDGDVIDGFFRPDHKVGQGSYGLVWKGSLNLTKVHNQHGAPLTSSKTTVWKLVAMKIVERNDFIIFERECRIYTKLLADKNDRVEQYGISTIWFEGVLLGKYHAFAMTFCPISIQSQLNHSGSKLEPKNVVAVFYQALKILKYIHGKEVIHLDLKPDNLMAKGAQLFLIDFNAADLIHDRCFNRGGNKRYASICHLMGIKEYYMDDLKSLYYVMMNLLGIKLPWQDGKLEELPKLRLAFDEIRDLCLQIESEPIRNLLIDYYNQVMINVTSLQDVEEDRRIFDYDAMGAKIMEVIVLLNDAPYPHFTWLSEDEKTEGENNFKPIDSITGPEPIDAPPTPGPTSSTADDSRLTLRLKSPIDELKKKNRKSTPSPLSLTASSDAKRDSKKSDAIQVQKSPTGGDAKNKGKKSEAVPGPASPTGGDSKNKIKKLNAVSGSVSPTDGTVQDNTNKPDEQEKRRRSRAGSVGDKMRDLKRKSFNALAEVKDKFMEKIKQNNTQAPASPAPAVSDGTKTKK